MKTQLIPLESHDDLISIRDRMSWAKTPRILLIWPAHESISLRPLDLKVLQRHARSLGAQLGLVTRRGSIRRQAQALGMPVFTSTGEAQRKPWPEPATVSGRMQRTPRQDLRLYREQVRGPKRSWQDLPGVRIGFFMLGVFAVLVLASIFIPKAEIHLRPETQIQQVTLPVYASPLVDQVFITGSIPAREVKVTLSGQDEMIVTGDMPVPETEAKGVVAFRNLTDEIVLIPAGTVVSTVSTDASVQFVTLEDVELPGGTDEILSVSVRGVDAGAAGNVQAGALRVVKGDLGLRVAVTNDEPMSGGRNRVVDTASDADRERLRENLLARLGREALSALRGKIGLGDQLFTDTIMVAQVLDESYNPPPGQPGRNVTLSMRVEFSAFYATEGDLTTLANLVLNASLEQGFVPAQESFDFEQVGSRVTGEDGITRWVLHVKRTLVRQVETLTAARLVLGRSPQVAAQRLLDRLQLSARPEIVLNPRWWPWLPLLPFNIAVKTQ